ncbi:tetratricopeptide repeat protein [Halomonas korlensis]|uniref:Tetratricopeptide repeat-containing protein n=1 Tax=Halomonas korlensis TaxID=463301 RepID=A0A1I7FIM6_9GAMM|nr:tetratricopeptide repeat protein [Halomonas korlensis]SFU36024.1 Tetratricopeptide repeat-containing protein [Halomonas korlensis]
MTHLHRTTKVFAVVLCVVVLGGCASNSRNSAGNDYGVLDDGGSNAAYSTAFPVVSPAEAYQNGEAAIRSGDDDRALFEYLRGLKLEKRPQAEPLYRIGTIHHGRENHELASLAYRWALDLEPRHSGAGTGLGIVLLQQRKHDEAEQQLRPIAARGDAPWQAHNALGVIADMQGKHDEASEHFRRALSVSPGMPRVLNNLGYSRYLAGDWSGARASLREAVSANPRYELAWRNLGLVYAREGDYEFAVEAVGRNGDRAKAYNDIGYISMLEGRFEQAMSLYQEAMRLSPAYYVTASENARSLDNMMRRQGGPVAN